MNVCQSAKHVIYKTYTDPKLIASAEDTGASSV